MNTMSMTREDLKAACLALLDQAAVEHPAGHQGKLAARYTLRSAGGERLGLMFEKSEKAKSHLWVDRRHVGDLFEAGIDYRIYPAASLYQEIEPGGKRPYGRHAALKPMRDLANADLVRFSIDRIDQLRMILTRLSA